MKVDNNQNGKESIAGPIFLNPNPNNNIKIRSNEQKQMLVVGEK